MSNDPGGDDYPLGPPARWPAADIAAAWRRELPGLGPTRSRSSPRSGASRRSSPTTGGAPSPPSGSIRPPSTCSALSGARAALQLTTREITRRTLITAGAVSQRVARAEQAGLVERAPSAASRRAVSVRLTDAGHALIEATVRRLLEHEADLIGPLDAAERSVLNALLTKLEEALTGS